MNTDLTFAKWPDVIFISSTNNLNTPPATSVLPESCLIDLSVAVPIWDPGAAVTSNVLLVCEVAAAFLKLNVGNLVGSKTPDTSFILAIRLSWEVNPLG